MVEAINRGFPQREIADASYEQRLRVESGERVIVGINTHIETQETEIDLHHVDPELEAKQLERLATARANRDEQGIEDALAALREAAAKESENLMPYLLDAARARASEGEMVAALQEVFGTYREKPIL